MERSCLESALFLMENPEFAPRRRKYFSGSLQNNMFLHLPPFDSHQKKLSGRENNHQQLLEVLTKCSRKVLRGRECSRAAASFEASQFLARRTTKNNNKRGWAGAVEGREAPVLAPRARIAIQKEPLIGVTNGGCKEESVPDQYAIHST